MWCTNCGSELEDGARFCVKCGTVVQQGASQAQPAAMPDVPSPQPQTPAPQPQPQAAPKKKSAAIPITIAAIVMVAVAIVLVVVFLMKGNDGTTASESTATEAASTSPVAAFQNDFMRVTLPSDLASKVSFSEANGWTTMTYTASDGTLVEIFPESYAPEYDIETKAESGKLGLALVNGRSEEVYMRLLYVGENDKAVHWATKEANELGVTKLLGMTADEFAGCIELYSGDGYDPATFTSNAPSSSTSASTSSSASSVPTSAFWGIWAPASKDKAEMEAEAARIKNVAGIDAFVVLTTDWSNLNSEPWYVVSLGQYATEDAAKAALPNVQRYYSDAYVKFSGSKK